jgi:dynein heavy chain 2, cytosolic
LETCFKVSYEAPPGIKQNFTRLLGGQAFGKDKKLELVATYFHALLQERRNYIPQGWNKFYEFNYGDYKSGLAIVQAISVNVDKNWEMLYGLMLDTIYGGRIDNDVDRKLLDVYLHAYFNDEIESGKQPLYKGVKVNQVEELIQKLPNIDNPDLYNLPMGIDKALLRIKAKELVENLKIATLTSDASTKFSRDEWNKSLTPIFALWKGLEKVSGEGKLKRLGEDKLKTVDPIESFVYGEYQEAILNHAMIKASFQRLEGVLFGNDILTT